MHVSMLSPRGGGGGDPGRCGAFDFSEEFLVKIPTMGQRRSNIRRCSINLVVFCTNIKTIFLPLLKAAVFQSRKQRYFNSKMVSAALVRFLIGRYHFRDTKKTF